MQAATGTRAEYKARIHRVQDYIERNLDRKLTLDEVAAVANFSAFHFHRLYHALTGESLYQFILRLRVERAASRLLINCEEPVTNIALDCGFSSSAAFARAFHAEFGMSATEWRSADSKIRETIRKKRKAAAGGSSDDGFMTASTKAASVRVENVETFPVAYIRHVGPYAGDTALFGRLFGALGMWAGPRGLIRPGETRWLSVFHDDPNITEEQNLRLSVCISVPPETPASGEVNIMEIAGGPYAKAHFELGSQEFTAAWNWALGEWLPSSGYQLDDKPCLEHYLVHPDQHPQKKHVVEIWLPVRPL